MRQGSRLRGLFFAVSGWSRLLTKFTPLSSCCLDNRRFYDVRIDVRLGSNWDLDVPEREVRFALLTEIIRVARHVR
jgi:hypothetical protein